jgi:hypothetical protein
MEQPEVNEPSPLTCSSGNAPAPVFSTRTPAPTSLVPQTCSNCGSAPAPNGTATAAPNYIYAIGRIEPRFPDNRSKRNLRKPPAGPTHPG